MRTYEIEHSNKLFHIGQDRREVAPEVVGVFDPEWANAEAACFAREYARQGDQITTNYEIVFWDSKITYCFFPNQLKTSECGFWEQL